MLTKNILSNLDEPVFSIKTKEWYEENSVNIILTRIPDVDMPFLFFRLVSRVCRQVGLECLEMCGEGLTAGIGAH